METLLQQMEERMEKEELDTVHRENYEILLKNRN